MKTWEANNSQKMHLKKLQNAKFTIRPNLKYPGTPRPVSAPQLNNLSKLLSEFSLQQYHKVRVTLEIKRN